MADILARQGHRVQHKVDAAVRHGWSDPQQHHLDFTPDKLAVLGGMADDAHAPAPVHTPREELAIAMA